MASLLHVQYWRVELGARQFLNYKRRRDKILRLLRPAKRQKKFGPTESKWSFYTILSGNVTVDNYFGLIRCKDCRNSCRVCPALVNTQTINNFIMAQRSEVTRSFNRFFSLFYLESFYFMVNILWLLEKLYYIILVNIVS